MYDAFADLAERYPSISVVTEQLAPGEMGSWDGTTLRLSDALTPAERNATLAHEIVHLDRGMPPADGVAEEEQVVEDIASRLLIDSTELGVAIGVALRRRASAIADELGVDRTSLIARIANLSPAELSTVARVAQATFATSPRASRVALPATA